MKTWLASVFTALAVVALPDPGFCELWTEAKIEFVPGGDSNGNGIFNPGDWIRYRIRVKNTGKQPVKGATIEFPIDTSFIGQIRSVHGYNADYTTPHRIRWVNQTFLPLERKSYSFEGTIKSPPTPVLRKPARYFRTVRPAPGRVGGVRINVGSPEPLSRQNAEPVDLGLGPPELVALIPSQGQSLAGRPTVFTTTVRDPDGWRDLKEVYLLLTDDFKKARPVYLLYDVSKKRFFVRNPENTEWVGQTPNGGSVIEAGPVKFHLIQSRAQAEGKRLVVDWAITLGKELAGRTYGLYYAAMEQSWKATEWKKAGQWTVEYRKVREGGGR